LFAPTEHGSEELFLIAGEIRVHLEQRASAYLSKIGWKDTKRVQIIYQAGGNEAPALFHIEFTQFGTEREMIVPVSAFDSTIGYPRG